MKLPSGLPRYATNGAVDDEATEAASVDILNVGEVSLKWTKD